MLKAHAFALPFAVFISCKCSCVCRVLCIDDASLALSYHTKPIIHSFAARPLDSVQEELETGADVFARVSQSTLRWFLFPYLLLVKKLRGVSCDGGDEVQSYDELLKVSSDTGNATLRTHTRPSPPENGHFSSSLKLGPSKRINAYGSNDESLKVWLDYSNFFLPYDVLVVGWKFGGHGWLSHVL